MTTADPAAMPALSPLLRGYMDQLAFIRRETAELADGITEAQFNWVPGPGRWSVGQVVNHLNISGSSYVERLEPLLADARAHGLRDRGDFKPSLVGGFLVRSMEPPPRKRFKAPRIWRPAEPGPALDRERELARLHTLHDRVEALIRVADGLDLRRIRIASPVSGLIRMNAGDALNLLLTHERRHLHQLRKVTEEAGYPAA
ncbi:MAG TPA: DinB family protein [Longimicrobium sp.]|nr:DinB family protein [Longimicrobium sp.]